MRSLGLCSCVVCMIIVGTSVQAQTCPPVVSGLGQSAEVSIRTPDKSCEVPDGGFVKANTSYRLHVNVTETGGCQTFTFGTGQCVPSTYYPRTAVGSSQKINNVQKGAVFGNSGVQNYDTCGNGDCTPVNTGSNGYAWSPPSVGIHVYTSLNTLGGGITACNMGMQFPGNNSVTVNAVACRPNFLNLPNGNTAHMPVGPIQIYVPSELSALNDLVDAAALDWTQALSGTGITVNRTTTQCSGGSCVNLSVGTVPPTGCASSQMITNSSGVNQVPVDLVLPTNWTSEPADRVQRSVAHELGHMFGLNDMDGTCSGTAAVMSIGVSCTATGVQVTPQLTDTLPVTEAVYGTSPKAPLCGF